MVRKDDEREDGRRHQAMDGDPAVVPDDCVHPEHGRSASLPQTRRCCAHSRPAMPHASATFIGTRALSSARPNTSASRWAQATESRVQVRIPLASAKPAATCWHTPSTEAPCSHMPDASVFIPPCRNLTRLSVHRLDSQFSNSQATALTAIALRPHTAQFGFAL